MTSKPEHAIYSGISMEGSYFLTVVSGVQGCDSNLGLDTELGNSSCDTKGKPNSVNNEGGKYRCT